MKLTVKPTLGQGPSDPEEDPIINFRLTPEECEESIDTHGQTREEWLNGLRAKHIEPTERQAALIDEAFDTIEEKLSSYGFDIPAICRNRPAILFLSRKDYWKGKYGKEEDKDSDSLGFYYANANTAVLWYEQKALGKDQQNATFLRILTHELLHAYSLRILQAYRAKEGEGKLVIDAHRIGMYIYKLGMSEKERFRGLDEALTEDLAVELTNDIISSRHVKGFEDVMRNQIHYLLTRQRGASIEQRAIDLGYRREMLSQYSAEDCERWLRERFPEDLKRVSNDPFRLAHLDEFGREIERMCEKNAEIAEIILNEGYHYKYPPLHQAYQKERNILHQLIVVLARKCPEYKGKEEELRTLFYEAKFSGSMVKIGRLIERTLGKGTFRLIAEDFLGTDLQDRLRLYQQKGQ